MEPKTTDEHIFKMRYRRFIPAVIAWTIATNTFTGYIIQQNTNTKIIEINRAAAKQEIEYNNARASRLAARAKKEAKDEMRYEILQTRYQDLKEVCREK